MTIRVGAAAGLLLIAGILPGCSATTAHLDSVPAAVGESTSPKELVVLVHGLGRTPLSLLPLEWLLEDGGYEIINWGYSSTCCSIAELAADLGSDLTAEVDDGQRVHFVGHSLGNLLIRSLLASNPPANTGNVVMLAPPNQGSHEADRYARWLGWLLTPLPELRTIEVSTAQSLPPAEAAVGIIAGRYDGKVSISESHLEGESAHIVVPTGHAFIMLNEDVHRLVLAFIRHGRFPPSAESVHMRP